MNSKDRRRERRAWKYKVETPWVFATGVVGMQDDYDAIWAWLKKNFGDRANTCGWRERRYGEVWEFNNSKKAAAFALRWAR